MMADKMKNDSEFVSGMLGYLAERLDDREIFPERQSPFFCSDCSQPHSFSYVLRDIARKLEQSERKRKCG